MKRCLPASLSLQLMLAAVAGAVAGAAAAEPALPPPAASGPPACAVPAELMEVDGKLPHLAARLRAERAGHDRRDRRRLDHGRRRRRRPISPIRTGCRWRWPRCTPACRSPSSTRACRGSRRSRWWSAFPPTCFAEDPVLVVWETGITDAVRGIDIDEFAGGPADRHRRGQKPGNRHRPGRYAILAPDRDRHRFRTLSEDDPPGRRAQRGVRVSAVRDDALLERAERVQFRRASPRTSAARLAAKVYDCIGRKLAEAIRTRCDDPPGTRCAAVAARALAVGADRGRCRLADGRRHGAELRRAGGGSPAIDRAGSTAAPRGSRQRPGR